MTFSVFAVFRHRRQDKIPLKFAAVDTFPIPHSFDASAPPVLSTGEKLHMRAGQSFQPRDG